MDEKELAFEGFALGTPPRALGDADNADDWLCVSLSNKAQFSMHLEVRQFWSSKLWIIFAQYFGLQHKPSTGG